MLPEMPLGLCVTCIMNLPLFIAICLVGLKESLTVLLAVWPYLA